MAVDQNDLEAGSEHSKPTTPTDDSAAGNIAESQADTLDGDKSSFNDMLDSQADAATLDSAEMTEEDLDVAEKEPLAGPSGTQNNKHKPSTSGAASNSLDDLISEEDVIMDKSRLDEDDSERLNTCTEDFESQISENGTQKKTWDVRCVVIGILVLFIMVAGAVAAIIAHRFKGPTVLYDIKFASEFEDGMILQRAPHKAVVWGYGPILGENTTVKVTLTAEGFVREYSTHVKSHGRGQVWKVILDEVSEPHGPFTLSAVLDVEDAEPVTVKDVLFGDIWICAGQFDINFHLRELQNSSLVQGMSDLRLFGLYQHMSNVARFDIRHFLLHWTPADKLESGSFPKLCLDYGIELQKRMKYPIGLVSMSYSDSTIEEWTPHRALKKCHLKSSDSSSSTVWHGMVTPLQSMSFYGAIWYQGEQDSIQLTSAFNCTFLHFLDHWRNHTFQHTHHSTDRYFPVGIIQLPPNRTNDHTAYSSFTDVRWGQTANYGIVPNELMKKVFMASTIDLPEEENENKDLPNANRDPNPIIVSRLMEGTLAVAYRRKDYIFQGPHPIQYKLSTTNKDLTLFMNNDEHIDVKNNNGFEMCCSESPSALCVASYTKATYAPGREWIPTPITSQTSSSVTVSWRECDKDYVVGLRYAWRDTPCPWEKCAIYGAKSELPMMPYIKQYLQSDGRSHMLTLNRTDLF